MDIIREALYLRKSEAPASTFDIGDLVAEYSLLSKFKAEDIENILHANMRVLGVAPADIARGEWRFGWPGLEGRPMGFATASIRSRLR